MSGMCWLSDTKKVVYLERDHTNSTTYPLQWQIFSHQGATNWYDNVQQKNKTITVKMLECRTSPGFTRTATETRLAISLKNV